MAAYQMDRSERTLRFILSRVATIADDLMVLRLENKDDFDLICLLLDLQIDIEQIIRQIRIFQTSKTPEELIEEIK